MLLLRILIFISVFLIFQEQFGFECLLSRGIYFYNITALLSVLVFVILLLRKELALKGNWLINSSVIFLFCLFISCLFSSNILVSIKYFSFLGLYAVFGFAAFQAFYGYSHAGVIKGLSFIIIIVSLLGVYDLIAANNNLIYFNKNIESNAMKSGFLFFGTAADYIHIMLSIVIPYQLSKKTNNKNLFLLNSIAICLGIIFLFGTTRVSVIISFVLSLILLFIFNAKHISIKYLVLSLLGSIVSVAGIIVCIPSLIDRVLYRFKTRIFERETNTLEADFFPENIRNAFSLFEEHKITGVGYGTSDFRVNGENFTVHGTFFKLLSETGIIGFLGYFCLLVSIGYFISLNYKKRNFTYHFVPFSIGLLISSVYNVHFVRIEFWLLLAVILLLSKDELIIKNDRIN